MAERKKGPALRISIVVPAYDDEAYVARALDSCCKQTYEDIEVVCVDDGSKDGTLQILRNYERQDGRVHVVALPENRGTHDARAAAVGRLSGQVVTFLDADDELSHDACARIAAEFDRNPVDILHFDMRVKGDGRAARGQAEALSEWMRPLAGPLKGRDILERSFRDLDYAFNLAGKAYRTQLVQKGFDALGSLRSDFGEDALEYFAVAFFSDSYRGLVGRRLYVYHLGDGLSARADMDEGQFARSLRGVDATEGMRRFLEGQGAFAKFADIYEAHCENQVAALMKSWFERVREDAQPACLARAFGTWPADEVVSAVCKLGTPGVERLRTCAAQIGEQVDLGAEQGYLCGYADAERAVRAEYEASASYRLGRVATALPRRMLKRR